MARKETKSKFGDLGLSNWLNNPFLFRNDFPRKDNFNLRMQYRPKFLEMKHRKDFKKLVESLRIYVQECIPAPRLTECEWWCVTCLPSTNQNTSPRLSVVNIHWMEILVIGHDVDDSRKVRAFINVDGDRLAATYPTEEALLEKYPFAGVTFPLYERSAETAGVNTVGLHADSIDHLLSLLNDNAILDAARYLNYRVMSLGRTVYARYHCYDLADLLVR